MWLKPPKPRSRPLTCEPPLLCELKSVSSRHLCSRVMMAESSQMESMLQRLMTRLDYLEFTLIKQTRDDVVNVQERVDRSNVDVADLSHTVGKMR